MLHLVALACRSPVDSGSSSPTDTAADTAPTETGGETGTPEKPDIPIASVTVVDGASGDMLGRSLSRIRDQDGDGQGDVVIAAPGHQGYTGAVYRFSSADLDGDLSLKEATLVFTGSEAGGYAGFGLATGDLDGDGVDDLLIGAPSLAQTTGAVYLLSGTLSGTVGEEDGDVLAGEVAGGGFGVRLATGDLNGDGSLETAVSATSDGTAWSEGGAVYVFSGPPQGSGPDDAQATLYGENLYGYGGISIAMLSDTLGDAHADLLVGEYGVSTARLLQGPLAGAVDFSNAGVSLVGEKKTPGFGYTVADGGAGRWATHGSADRRLPARRRKRARVPVRGRRPVSGLLERHPPHPDPGSTSTSGSRTSSLLLS